MRIILLGAPGAGKGSQAEKISSHLGIPHISTGDAFRSNIARGTEIGVYAKTFMDKGELVPDEVVVGIVAERLSAEDCRGGFLLDGFPRSIPQAEALEKLADIDKVIEIAVSDEVIVKRLTGRMSCACGATYSVVLHPSDICDRCGRELFVRDDDKEETVRARIEVYNKTTAPLADFYSKRGKLVRIDGDRPMDEVFQAILRAIENDND